MYSHVSFSLFPGVTVRGRECVFLYAVQSQQDLGLACFLNFPEHSCFSLIRTCLLGIPWSVGFCGVAVLCSFAMLWARADLSF